MALMVETKDCTALSDAEIEEMADLIEDEPVVFDVGELSKQRDAWVLVTQVRDGNKWSHYDVYEIVIKDKIYNVFRYNLDVDH